MEKRYFVIYEEDGSIEITGEHINDLNPKMIDEIHDNGSSIKSITHEELLLIHKNNKDGNISHFYNYD